ALSDENGVVSHNKDRLVAQGYNQQEGINYDETYAPIARLKSIRILLAYACALDFKLFQMDVKSAFLNGFINEDVYLAQPPRFIDFKKANRVYKLKKALYGLKQASKSCSTCQIICDDFSKIMHDEFEMSMMDELNFFLGLQIKQMKDGCCLTSWFSKKQTTLAISTTEAEYVSVRKACQQALWMKQALINYDIRLDDVPLMCNNKSVIDLSKNVVPVAPEVGAAAVASPAEVLELDTHSSSEADPLESLPLAVSVAPMDSPFLCLDDLDSNTKILERHVSPKPHDAMLTRWRSEALTARKSVIPLPSHRLASRSAPLSTMYPLTKSESSAEVSSSESSAGPSHKRCRSLIAIVTSSIHDTRALVPSRTDLLPSRKRFRDSISPDDSVEDDIDTDVLEDIEAEVMAIEVAVDRDVEAEVDTGIDLEVDVGVDIKDEVDEEVKSNDRGTMEVKVDMVAGIDIPDGMLMSDTRIEDIETGQRELEARSLIAGGERASLLEQVASLERSNARLQGIIMMERARADRFQQRVIFMESELRQICRFCNYDMMRFRRLETFTNMTITRFGMTPKAIKELVNRRVEEALVTYEATRTANALEAENQSQNGSDDDNGNGGNGNGRDGNSGNGNGRDGNSGNGNGGNVNLNENNRDARPVIQECTYQDFMKCQPLNFKGTKGVVGLIRWFEKIETIFHINNCLEKYQVKYATCTLLNSALTWWNLHKRTVGTEASFLMSWRELMKLMAEVYCPRNEIQKMEWKHYNQFTCDTILEEDC
nr:copia protein [Tanacetum cinerariifolium]